MSLKSQAMSYLTQQTLATDKENKFKLGERVKMGRIPANILEMKKVGNNWFYDLTTTGGERYNVPEKELKAL